MTNIDDEMLNTIDRTCNKKHLKRGRGRIAIVHSPLQKNNLYETIIKKIEIDKLIKQIYSFRR